MKNLCTAQWVTSTRRDATVFPVSCRYTRCLEAHLEQREMDWQMSVDSFFSQGKEIKKLATKWIIVLNKSQSLLLKILHNIALRPKYFFQNIVQKL